MAQGLGLKIDDSAVAGWRKRLDAKGQAALVAAVNIAEWAYGAELRKNELVLRQSHWHGHARSSRNALRAQARNGVQGPKRSLRVRGRGLAWEKLVPLFRYGTIKRIDQVFEFRLNRKRMAQSSATEDPGKVLSAVLRESGSLPATVENLLGTKPKTGGKIGIRACGCPAQARGRRDPESHSGAPGDSKAISNQGHPPPPHSQEPIKSR